MCRPIQEKYTKNRISIVVLQVQQMDVNNATSSICALFNSPLRGLLSSAQIHRINHRMESQNH